MKWKNLKYEMSILVRVFHVSDLKKWIFLPIRYFNWSGLMVERFVYIYTGILVIIKVKVGNYISLSLKHGQIVIHVIFRGKCQTFCITAARLREGTTKVFAKSSLAECNHVTPNSNQKQITKNWILKSCYNNDF